MKVFFSTYLELVRASSLRPLLVQVVAHNLVYLLGGLGQAKPQYIMNIEQYIASVNHYELFVDQTHLIRHDSDGELSDDFPGNHSLCSWFVEGTLDAVQRK